MLDKLIESKNNAGANRRLSGFMASAFTAVTSVLAVGLIYSLFSYNLAMDNENPAISALLAPLANFENTPPEAAPIKKRQSDEKPVGNQPLRQDNVQRPDESPVNTPVTISVAPMTKQARPNSPFKIAPDDVNPNISGSGANGRNNDENATGIFAESKPQALSEGDDAEKAPVIKTTPKPNPPTKTLVSKGVINGEAKNLVKPAYPQAARLIGISGEVRVQVTIDEEGRVMSAVAVSGHSLLKPSAVNAARLSTFTPTYLSDQKVKVTGIIIYNFTR